MPTPVIVLRDKAGADVEYAHQSTSNGVMTYVHMGDSLMDTSIITLSIRRGVATNRCIGKLSIPHVVVNPDTLVPSIMLTEVGSFDLSSVKAAPAGVAEDFHAQFSSLSSSAVVKSMYVSGTL